MSLNVDLTPAFLDRLHADELFLSLSTYPFETRSIKVAGRKFTPTRQICAFSDEGIAYTFSAIAVEGKPWTTELLALKEQLEVFTGSKYNYVLLNYYPDGNSGIGHHRDDEQDLDPSTPIATVSFGAEREIQFSRKGCPSTHYRLQHGSLLLMKPPTNRLYTHSILRDPTVTESRISLTFRKINPQPQKRGLSEDDSSNKRPRVENLLPSNDWFELFLRQNPTFPNSKKEYAPFTLVAWPIKHNTFVTVDYFRGKMLIHLREFVERKDTYLPTKDGITMSPETWYYFSERLCEQNLPAFIENGSDVNNVFYFSPEQEGGEHRIQFWTRSTSGEPVLSNKIFKIWVEQLIALSEISKHITTAILEGMYTVILPRKLCLEENLTCLKPTIADDWIEEMKSYLRETISNELSKLSGKITKCFFVDCIHNASENALLLLNMDTLAKCITTHPYFFCLDAEFFKQHMSMSFFKECCN